MSKSAAWTATAPTGTTSLRNVRKSGDGRTLRKPRYHASAAAQLAVEHAQVQRATGRLS